ncbi:F-box/LRR-repeat protein At3g59190-like [Silene latifolia]|uniref:F-box/LRR-repeat protein At3g59190-like n=1 Tax=Silene latifolia TaxID=37657 RepID=UPI003D76ABCC
MRPPMKLGKHVDDPISEDCCFDRITSLPEELLSHLLSFLPTRCAVRTSTLSTRWRYLFTLTTSLSFDDAPCFGLPGRNEVIEATRKFKLFVDKVLELHQISPINKFTLLCKCTYDNSDLNRWISVAVQKGVQELHYKFLGQGDYCLPEVSFMCETLVSLTISSFHNLFQTPPSVSLPNLKILNLDRIIFTDFNSMERLFYSCVSLEELTLKCCASDAHGHAIYRTGILKVLVVERCSFRLGTFEIDAPNLAYLTYSSNIGVKIVPSWKYSCSFIQAELSFMCYTYDDFDASEDSVGYDRELLKAAAYKASKLSFEMDSQMTLYTLGDEEQMPDFPSLSRLQLDDCPYESWKYVTSLIDKSPQLETVIFGSGFHCCQCSSGHYYPDRCACNYQSPSDIPLEALVPFSCHAQVIEVCNFCGHKGSLSLMGHLLRNASVLKRLVVFTICHFNPNPEEELKIINDLLMLPRASLDCCLEINKVAVPSFHCMSYVEVPQ